MLVQGQWKQFNARPNDRTNNLDTGTKSDSNSTRFIVCSKLYQSHRYPQPWSNHYQPFRFVQFWQVLQIQANVSWIATEQSLNPRVIFLGRDVGGGWPSLKEKCVYKDLNFSPLFWTPIIVSNSCSCHPKIDQFWGKKLNYWSGSPKPVGSGKT